MENILFIRAGVVNRVMCSRVDNVQETRFELCDASGQRGKKNPPVRGRGANTATSASLCRRRKLDGGGAYMNYALRLSVRTRRPPYKNDDDGGELDGENPLHALVRGRERDSGGRERGGGRTRVCVVIIAYIYIYTSRVFITYRKIAQKRRQVINGGKEGPHYAAGREITAAEVAYT